MNTETINAMTTLLGSKKVAECAVSYLARCRDVPTAEHVAKALHVPATTARKIVAAATMCSQFVLDTMPIKVSNPGLVAAYLSDLKNERVEHVVVLTAASDNTLIKRHECSTGSGSRAAVDPGVIFTHAVRDGARSVIVVHNHPSGSPKFSPDDYDFTRQLIAAGKVLNVHLLDSIVISRRGVSSMRAEAPDMFA